MPYRDDVFGCRNSAARTLTVSTEKHLRLPQMSGAGGVLLEEHSAYPPR